MLYGIEGILNGKLFGNGEGGSSGGGITLPTLTNPAGADQILEGYEAIDGSGNKLTGTHVCESGGGANWVPLTTDGTWTGENVTITDVYIDNTAVVIPSVGTVMRIEINGVATEGPVVDKGKIVGNKVYPGVRTSNDKDLLVFMPNNNLASIFMETSGTYTVKVLVAES